jgi:hypothetical protein
VERWAAQTPWIFLNQPTVRINVVFGDLINVILGLLVLVIVSFLVQSLMILLLFVFALITTLLVIVVIFDVSDHDVGGAFVRTRRGIEFVSTNNVFGSEVQQ